jgi:hypothetical protein
MRDSDEESEGEDALTVFGKKGDGKFNAAKDGKLTEDVDMQVGNKRVELERGEDSEAKKPRTEETGSSVSGASLQMVDALTEEPAEDNPGRGRRIPEHTSEKSLTNTPDKDGERNSGQSIEKKETIRVPPPPESIRQRTGIRKQATEKPRIPPPPQSFSVKINKDGGTPKPTRHEAAPHRVADELVQSLTGNKVSRQPEHDRMHWRTGWLKTDNERGLWIPHEAQDLVRVDDLGGDYKTETLGRCVKDEVTRQSHYYTPEAFQWIQYWPPVYQKMMSEQRRKLFKHIQGDTICLTKAMNVAVEITLLMREVELKLSPRGEQQEERLPPEVQSSHTSIEIKRLYEEYVQGRLYGWEPVSWNPRQKDVQHGEEMFSETYVKGRHTAAFTDPQKYDEKLGTGHSLAMSKEYCERCVQLTYPDELKGGMPDWVHIGNQRIKCFNKADIARDIELYKNLRSEQISNEDMTIDCTLGESKEILEKMIYADACVDTGIRWFESTKWEGNTTGEFNRRVKQLDQATEKSPDTQLKKDDAHLKPIDNKGTWIRTELFNEYENNPEMLKSTMYAHLYRTMENPIFKMANHSRHEGSLHLGLHKICKSGLQRVTDIRTMVKTFCNTRSSHRDLFNTDMFIQLKHDHCSFCQFMALRNEPISVNVLDVLQMLLSALRSANWNDRIGQQSTKQLLDVLATFAWNGIPPYVTFTLAWDEQFNLWCATDLQMCNLAKMHVLRVMAKFHGGNQRDPPRLPTMFNGKKIRTYSQRGMGQKGTVNDDEMYRNSADPECEPWKDMSCVWDGQVHGSGSEATNWIYFGERPQEEQLRGGVYGIDIDGVPIPTDQFNALRDGVLHNMLSYLLAGATFERDVLRKPSWMRTAERVRKKCHVVKSKTYHTYYGVDDLRWEMIKNDDVSETIKKELYSSKNLTLVRRTPKASHWSNDSRQFNSDHPCTTVCGTFRDDRTEYPYMAPKGRKPIYSVESGNMYYAYLGLMQAAQGRNQIIRLYREFSENHCTDMSETALGVSQRSLHDIEDIRRMVHGTLGGTTSELGLICRGPTKMHVQRGEGTADYMAIFIPPATKFVPEDLLKEEFNYPWGPKGEPEGSELARQDNEPWGSDDWDDTGLDAPSSTHSEALSRVSVPVYPARTKDDEIKRHLADLWDADIQITDLKKSETLLQKRLEKSHEAYTRMKHMCDQANKRGDELQRGKEELSTKLDEEVTRNNDITAKTHQLKADVRSAESVLVIERKRHEEQILTAERAHDTAKDKMIGQNKQLQNECDAANKREWETDQKLTARLKAIEEAQQGNERLVHQATERDLIIARQSQQIEVMKRVLTAQEGLETEHAKSQEAAARSSTEGLAQARAEFNEHQETQKNEIQKLKEVIGNLREERSTIITSLTQQASEATAELKLDNQHLAFHVRQMHVMRSHIQIALSKGIEEIEEMRILIKFLRDFKYSDAAERVSKAMEAEGEDSKCMTEGILNIRKNIDTVTAKMVNVHEFLREMEAGVYPRPVFNLKRTECSTTDLLATYQVQQEMYRVRPVASILGATRIIPHPKWRWPFAGNAMPKIHDFFMTEDWGKYLSQMTPILNHHTRNEVSVSSEGLQMREYVILGNLPEVEIEVTHDMNGVVVVSDGHVVTNLIGSEAAIQALREGGVEFNPDDNPIYCNISSIRGKRVNIIDPDAVDNGLAVSRRCVINQHDLIGVFTELNCVYKVKRLKTKMTSIAEDTCEEYASCQDPSDAPPA